jgi:hypothetical protein
MSDQLEAEVQETLELDTPIEEVEAHTDTTSDTVSDSEEKHEEKSTFTPEQKATADYAFKARETKRENDELKRQLAEAQQPVVNDRPAVTELSEYPEPEEIQAFQKATQDAAVWDYQQTQQQEADYNAQVTAQTQQAEQTQKLRTDFVANSTAAGIKLEDLQTAGNVVESYGLNPQIAQSIMADSDGGLVLLQLATNPNDIAALNNANMLTLGTLYADIKAKSANLKPKQSAAPAPAEILSGNGSPPKEGGPEGATYE